MEEKEKKYYWLKLKKDFFKRHDIRIIESQSNGKDYILFYLKLLCESVDHEGNLRFNESIPYNEEMLATITNTNIDIVRSAIKIFTQLEMMEIFDDGTYFMNEVNKLMGCETEWAKKKREYREKHKLGLVEDNVLPLSDKSKSIELDIEKEKDIELDMEKENISKRKFSKPSLQDVQDYINEKGYHFNADDFINHYEAVGWKVGKSPMKDWRACCRTWESNYKKKPNSNNNKNNWLDNLDDKFKEEILEDWGLKKF